MKGLFLFLFPLLIFSCNQKPDFKLQDGDILFQDLDCGIYCESIETVTLGYQGANLSHCGIVIVQDQLPYVMEAISKGVSLTPLDSFLSRSYDAYGNPKVIVGRLSEEYKSLIPNAVTESKKHLGKEYDAIYDIENEKMYCSELVYYSYKNQEEHLFELHPMTFKALDSDSTFAAWRDYFTELDVPIPEEELGLNPGSISLSDKINMVHFYGNPDGMVLEMTYPAQ